MSKKIEALAGPSQLPTSVGLPEKLIRPSGQRGAGLDGGGGLRAGACACGCCGAACCACTARPASMPSATVPMASFFMGSGSFGYGAAVLVPAPTVWLLEVAAPSASPVLLRVTRRALALLLPSRASQPSTWTSSPILRLLRFQPAFCSMCGGPISKAQLLTFCDWSVTST